MTERILVFRGDSVSYDPLAETITCISDNGCFRIKDVGPLYVRGENVEVLYLSDGTAIVEGTELWSDGDYWIIKEWRPRQ